MKTRCGTCDVEVLALGNSRREIELLGASLWPNGYPCVQWHCGGTATPALGGETSADVLELTVEQYFRALHGAGLPDEANPDYATVSYLLRDQNIEAVDLADIDGRSVLSAIHLETATLHLAASSKGAVVFKITKKETGNEQQGEVGVPSGSTGNSVRGRVREGASTVRPA